MKTIRMHKIWLYCFGMMLSMIPLFVDQASAVCTINPSGTYIEAEHFSGASNLATGSGHPDDNDKFVEVDEVGTNGGKVLVSGSSGAASDVPVNEVKEYSVNFSTTGTYYVWVRGKASAAGDGSMFFRLDNSGSWKAWNYDNINTYTWISAMQVGSPNTIDVTTAGIHTLKIAMRESGSRFDGFYITQGTETPTDANVPNSVTSVNPKAGCVGPQWTVSSSSLGPTCFFGYDAASMSFDLTNIGENDTLTATVSSNQTWASVNSGSSTIPILNKDGSFTVTVDFNTAALAIGSYAAEITVTGAASNSPLKIPVTLLVKDVPATAACGKVPLYAQNLVNPAIMVQLDVSGSMGSNMSIASLVEQKTTEIKTIVQEIVDRAGWAENNNMAIVLNRTSGTGIRRAWSYDGLPGDAPKLTVTYTKDSVTTTVERRISNSDNDLQKTGVATIDKANTYLELGVTDKPVGLLFSDVSIPVGATVDSAEISFSSYQPNNTAVTIDIKGVAVDDISTLTIASLSALTTASQTWTPGNWGVTMSRIDIAEDVLKEVFLDRSIAWGFGTWTSGNSAVCDSTTLGGSYSDSCNYTIFRVGAHEHDDAHQAALQDKVDDESPKNMTPLAPSLMAGRDYFKGNRKDLHYSENYTPLSCQPRILVIVTDGEGNTGTTNATIDTATQALIDEGVSVVTVGFGLTTTLQLDRIAQKMQTAGELHDDDYLYHLHNENVSGVAVPFMAQNRQEFIAAMNSIVNNVKAQIFHGSSPAPTTSVDNGELLLNASFDASDWSGNLTAIKFNSYTGELEAASLWSAKLSMPAAINGYIYDSTATNKVSPYTDASIVGDHFLCKTLGDIINSTPAIVGKPPYYYKFDSYFTYKYNPTVRARDALAYVGSNDGALHAFKLSNGAEKWRFYPDSVKSKMALATTTPQDDMCSAAYCHKFLLDGSPEPADIYVDATNGWRTILTTGLGEGGSAYFALDVTYGEDFASTTTNPSKFLWEYTGAEDGELGLATSWPTVSRVKNGAGAGWATLISSGKVETNQANKEAYLFALNSWDKSKVWKDSAGVLVSKVKLSSSTLKNDYPAPPLAVESRTAALDYIADRVYLGNQYGNMYRVKNVGFNEQAVSELFYNANKADHATPVTAKAEFANVGNAAGDIWIYFGSGSYVEEVDKFTVYQQYFFGLFDPGAAKAAPYVQSDLVPIQTHIIEGYALDKDGNKVDMDKDGTAGDADDLQKYRTLSCPSPDAEGRCNPSNLSWLLQLAIPSGGGSERVISQPLVVAGIVFFTTFVPDGDVCAGNGETWLFAVDWKSGEFLTEAVFDLNKDNNFSSADTTVKQSDGTISKVSGFYIGTGKPSGEIAIHNDLLFVGTTGQPPSPIKVNLPDMQTKLRSWQQVSN